MKVYWRKNWLFWLVNIVAAIPLILLTRDFYSGALGVNPITEITHRTGKTAVQLLLLCLACTPLITFTGWRQPGTVRKSLGLWAFVYASFHLLNFVGLDYGFDFGFILMDGLPTKPYIVVGLLAFLLLVPLAITSTKGWQRRLGKNWKKLHKAVYVVGIAAIVHFFWAVKAADDWEPALYGVALTLLLAARIPAVRRKVVAWRTARFPANSPAPAARKTAKPGLPAPVAEESDTTLA